MDAVEVQIIQVVDGIEITIPLEDGLDGSGSKQAQFDRTRAQLSGVTGCASFDKEIWIEINLRLKMTTPATQATLRSGPCLPLPGAVDRVIDVPVGAVDDEDHILTAHGISTMYEYLIVLQTTVKFLRSHLLYCLAKKNVNTRCKMMQNDAKRFQNAKTNNQDSTGNFGLNSSSRHVYPALDVQHLLQPFMPTTHVLSFKLHSITATTVEWHRLWENVDFEKFQTYQAMNSNEQ